MIARRTPAAGCSFPFMSVRKNQRSESRFSTLDIILDLYNHTTTLTANEKIFDRTYTSLIDRINDEAAMIYHLCRVANEDLDNRIEEEAQERLRLQAEAVGVCLRLKTDIRLAQRRFKLRAKKVVFWNDLVNKALASIKAWNAAEKRTYKNVFGL